MDDGRIRKNNGMKRMVTVVPVNDKRFFILFRYSLRLYLEFMSLWMGFGVDYFLVSTQSRLFMQFKYSCIVH